MNASALPRPPYDVVSIDANHHAGWRVGPFSELTFGDTTISTPNGQTIVAARATTDAPWMLADRFDHRDPEKRHDWPTVTVDRHQPPQRPRSLWRRVLNWPGLRVSPTTYPEAVVR